MDSYSDDKGKGKFTWLRDASDFGTTGPRRRRGHANAAPVKVVSKTCIGGAHLANH